MRGYRAVPDVWVGAGRGVGLAADRFEEDARAFRRAVARQPFGQDDLGRALFEGDPGAGAPGFVGRRDDLLKDLTAAVDLLRRLGSRLERSGLHYAEAEAAMGAPTGLSGPSSVPRVPPCRLDGSLGEPPSTVPPPGIVLRAQWFFESVGLGCPWPDGDIGGVADLRDAAAALAHAVESAREHVAWHSGRVPDSGFGDATERSEWAALLVHGKGGLLEELKRRCEELEAYCESGIDAIAKAQRHFEASAAYVLTLMLAATLLGPAVEAAVAPLIRLEGIALLITQRMIREAVLGAAYSGGLDAIDQLFRGTADPSELARALWQGAVAGGLMGGSHAALPSVLRRGPALTALADALESRGAKGITSRFLTGGTVGTVAMATADAASGNGWDLERAAESGFGMAFLGAGAEAVGGALRAGLRLKRSTALSGWSSDASGTPDAPGAAPKIGPDWVRSEEKRRADRRRAWMLMPIAGPLIFVGATLKFAEDRRSPFFSQERVGQGGVTFLIHKLRTMRDGRGTDASLGSGDPRATPVGRILRKLTIDELPQLLNILKGEMALVGPRPLLEGDIRRMAEVLDPDLFNEWYEAYKASRPGLLGMFGNESITLTPQSEEYLRRRAELDIEYFRNASPELDRKIIKATLQIGLSFLDRRASPAHEAANPPADVPPHAPDGAGDPGTAPPGHVPSGAGDPGTAPPGHAALPVDVHRWWTALTPRERTAWETAHPALLGSLDGIPAEVRDRANRVLLQEQKTELTEEWQRIEAPSARDETSRRRLSEIDDALNGLRVIEKRLALPGGAEHPRAYLLSVSTEGTGRAIIAFGDPDTAAHVATYVPGARSRLGTIETRMRTGEAVAVAARQAGEPSTAVITWLGYEAPQTIPRAVDRRFAHAATPDLHRFQDGLRVTHQGPRSHNTVIGHSYGSVVVGYAARDGLLNADDVVFEGSPGVGVPHAGRLRLAGVRQGEVGYHVHATIARWDFIRLLAAHGRRPTAPAFGARTFVSHPGTRGPWYFGGLSREAHGEYWLPGNPALTHLGEIVTGRSGAPAERTGGSG
ncbi:hypothetical protein GCM10010151_67770 [Actinoallomurus spadix]|uniref:Bacterial sugar transferase domain-containing protein n=2 Tax=Actinoallomurus spadix TaxID=79912 RepID=A0ABN0XMU6_9ACTN